jgi:hypothetical protein
MKSNFMPIEKYYSLKHVFESLWGKGTYLELKHCSDISKWKKYSTRTLQASLVAIEETVQIKDEEWQETVNNIVSHGIDMIKLSKDFDDLFQSLSAAYMQLSFHQIGLMPTRPSNVRPTLRKQDWKLDGYRTTIYMQTPDQKKTLERRTQRDNEARERIKAKENENKV